MWTSFVFEAAFALGALEFFRKLCRKVSWSVLETLSQFFWIESVSVYCFFMSFQTDWMMIRSDLCVEQTKITGLLQLMTKINVWKLKLIFPTDTLQQKIEITDLKAFLAVDNTIVLIILSTTVDLCCFNIKHVYWPTQHNHHEAPSNHDCRYWRPQNTTTQSHH